MVADVRDLDDSGRAGHGPLPAAAGDCFRGDPLISEKRNLPFSDYFRKLFLQRLQLIQPDLLLNPHCTITQSAAILTLSANSFRESLFTKLFTQICLKQNSGIAGIHSSSSSIKMMMIIGRSNTCSQVVTTRA